MPEPVWPIRATSWFGSTARSMPVRASGFLALIPKRNVAEFDPAAERRECHRIRRGSDLRFVVEDFAHALRPGRRLARAVDQPGELLDRRGEHQHVGVEGHDLADRHLALEDHLAAEEQDEDRADRDEQGGRRHDLGPFADDLQAGLEIFPVAFVKAADLVLLARKGPHDLHARDVFLQARRQVAEGQIDVVEQFRDAVAEQRRSGSPGG